MRILNKADSRRLIRDIKKKHGVSFADIGKRFHPAIKRQAVNNWYRLGLIPNDRVNRLKYLLEHWDEIE